MSWRLRRWAERRKDRRIEQQLSAVSKWRAGNLPIGEGIADDRERIEGSPSDEGEVPPEEDFSLDDRLEPDLGDEPIDLIQGESFGEGLRHRHRLKRRGEYVPPLPWIPFAFTASLVLLAIGAFWLLGWLRSIK